LFNALIGKEFSYDRVIFEGEWKDGKMNGQGKKSDLLNNFD